MPVIPLANPYTMKQATMLIEGNNYETALTGVTFNPTKPAPITLINGSKVNGTSSWTVTLGMVQDLSTAGFTRYCLANDGESVAATFVPETGGPSVTCTLVVSAAPFGGDAGDQAVTASVTFDVSGTPAFTDPI